MAARGRSMNLLRWGQWASIAVAMAAAFLILAGHGRHRHAVIEQIREQHRLKLVTAREHIEEYFDEICMNLRLLSYNPTIKRLSRHAQSYLQTIIEAHAQRHHISEIHILRSDYDGRQEPFLSFKNKDAKDRLVDRDNRNCADQLSKEWRAHLQRFNENPTLASLISSPLSLCSGQHGVVVSVPIRGKDKLVGIASGIVSTSYITETLERGTIRSTIILTSDRGTFFTCTNADEDVKSWFQTRFEAMNVAEAFHQLGDDFHIDHFAGLWTPIKMPDDREWFLALVYDESDLLSQIGVFGDIVSWGIAVMVLLLGGVVALLFRNVQTLILTRQRTDRQMARLAESEATKRGILDAATDGIITIDERGIIESFNHAAEIIFGYQSDEVIGSRVNILMQEPESRHHDDHIAQYLKTGEDKIIGIDREAIGRRKDGSSVHIDLSIGEVCLRDRRLFTGIVRDISERKRFEAELKRLSRFPEENPHPVLEVHRDGKVRYFNPAANALMERLDLSPDNCERLLPDDFQELIELCIQEQSGVIQCERQLNDRTISWSFRPALDSDLVHVYGRDVTDYKELETELSQLLAEAECFARDAEAANLTKSEFLANMSHEIRTPMTAILGFSENLLDHDLAESQRKNFLQTIRRNGEHLLEIINDILDLSKVEAGKLEVERITFSPIQLVADVHSLMKVRADDKSLSLEVCFVGSIPETIQTDITRLRQILVNLIGNAIKFTHKGSVRLVTRLIDTPVEIERLTEEVKQIDRAEKCCDSQSEQPCSSSSRLQFEVIDSGIGMNRSQIDELFLPFRQADTSTTRKFGGTGLGLTISKRLTEMLGGDIAVESNPGSGSTFRATVATGSLENIKLIDCPHEELERVRQCLCAELAGQDAASIQHNSSTKLSPCRILLAEDGLDNQRLITHILKKAGAEVTVVENGRQAMDKAMGAVFRRRKTDPSKPFDVVLMDMQMPVLDGYQATQQLRKSGYTGTILALTAHAMSSDRDKCLAAGCDDYVTKPINRRFLIESIQRYLKQSAEQPAEQIDSRQDAVIIVSEVADDPDFAGLLEMFGADLPERIEAIQRAMADEDFDSVATLAHQLNGTAGSFGFPIISHAAKRLEDAVMNALKDEMTLHTIADLREKINELTELCNKARARLSSPETHATDETHPHALK